MITQNEFELVAKSVAYNPSAMLPKMVGYKSSIQREVLDIASPDELKDVMDCRINQGMIDKLCRLAKRKWLVTKDSGSLYCAAMAVATIIKEYGWGTVYLVGEGFWEVAQRIQNA